MGLFEDLLCVGTLGLVDCREQPVVITKEKVIKVKDEEEAQRLKEKLKDEEIKNLKLQLEQVKKETAE